jgi:predicted neuraminidase
MDRAGWSNSMNDRWTFGLGMIVSLGVTWSTLGQTIAIGADADPAILRNEFIYEKPPTPECHAATIVATPDGLAAAWFGGTYEKHDDVGIWFARRDAKGWSEPVEVVNGVQDAAKRYPTWNPVLHQAEGGPLVLFYKVGPSPDTWWGMRMHSSDGGKSWSEPARLPDEILGPVKNKAVTLSDGRLLCGSSSEHDGWRIHMEWTFDLGETWKRTEALEEANGDPHVQGAIQPTIFTHTGGRVQILCRSRGTGHIVSAWSSDLGETWTKLETISLPNPNSGIDGVTLADGRRLLVYNHTTQGRSPLNVAVSKDGLNWQAAVVLESEPGEYSYPAVIQSPDGLVHIAYTWKRKLLKHVTLDPSKYSLREIENGVWP